MKRILLTLFCLGVGIQIAAQDKRNLLHTMESAYFKTKRTVQVHLPKKYTKEERLPVIYVFDAQWDTYFNLTTAVVDYLTETREFPRSIVVGIHSEKRQYELTPTPVNEDWQMPSLGGAKLLENHILHEVAPWLQLEYNTQAFTIGIGHSLGGTFVLNSLVDNKTLFNAYIAISPNLQIDDEEISLKIQRNILQLKQTNTFVFTTMGTQGNPDSMFLPYLQRLDAVVKKHNTSHFNWNFSVYPDFNHATSPMESIHRGLLKLAKKWHISQTQKEQIANSKDPLLGFLGFYKELSNWTGYQITPSKNNYFEMAGFLENKNKHKAVIALYKNATTHFPTVSRFYNNIAENMLKLGATTEAKTYLERALKVLEKENFDYAGDKPYFKNLYTKNLKKIAQQ